MKKQAQLENCPACGRLFSAYSGNELCSACATGLDEKRAAILNAIEQHHLVTPEDIAEATGLDPQEVRRIARETRNIRNRIVLHETCSVCGDHDPLPGSDYCLRCQMTLFRDISDVASELSRKAERLAAAVALTATANNTRTVLDQKRRRRLNPSPPYRIR